jgi:hypothetical protein
MLSAKDNKNDTNLIWSIAAATLQFFITAALFIFVYFVVCKNVNAEMPKSQPRYGDHLCWYSSTKKQCGTYGWDKSEKKAKVAALKLCLKECDESCALDYCERLEEGR